MSMTQKRHHELFDREFRDRKAVGGEMQRRVYMGAGMLVHAELEKVELVFRILEPLLAEELLLTEIGRKLFVEFMGEIGDAAMTGGQCRRSESHAGCGNARRTGRGRTEKKPRRDNIRCFTCSMTHASHIAFLPMAKVGSRSRLPLAGSRIAEPRRL